MQRIPESIAAQSEDPPVEAAVEPVAGVSKYRGNGLVQPRNPLHGLTLETILTALHAHYGWEGLATRSKLKCFSSTPSLASSLKFLRKTAWAREKIESLYLFMLREQRRQQAGAPEG